MRLDSNKCARAMAEKCLDITMLSEKTGLTFKSVSQAVRGITQPRAKKLAKLCAALECEPRDILSDKQE